MEIKNGRSEEENKKSYNRRTGPDIWVKLRRIFAIIIWPVLFITLLLLDFAKPQVETFFDRLYNINIRDSWNTEFTNYIFILMIIGFFSSILGLIISSKRNRRRSDKYPFSFIFMAVLSLIGILLHFFYM